MEKALSVVITLLKEGFDVDEIQEVLKISPEEFNQVLKKVRELGYNYCREIFSDGKMIIKGSRCLNLNPKKTSKITVKDSILHTIFTSDFHLGGPFEQPKRLKALSDYAASHDIHIIINTGDIINDYYPDHDPELKYPYPEDQAKRYLEYTPQQKGLYYFNLGGNHDYKSLDEKFFDSIGYYEQERYDMVSLGYGRRQIVLQQDSISVAHDMKKLDNNITSTMIFRGHSHKSKTRDNHIIYVPALTDNYQGAYEFAPVPGFLDVKFLFFDDKITRVDLRQLAFVNENIRLANEVVMTIRPDYLKRMENRNNKKLAKQKK